METESEHVNLAGPSEIKPNLSEELEEGQNYEIQNMFDKILRENGAFFRQQQRNEPDLTGQEKLDIVQKLYAEKPAIFLTRYEHYLNWQDAKFFENSSKFDQDVKFFHEKLNLKQSLAQNMLKNGHKRRNSSKIDFQEKNLRFIQMKKMLNDKKSDYFSDKEMRRRHPLLYDQMIGNYQNEQEMASAFHNSSNSPKNCPLSSALLDMYDNKMISEKKYEEENLESLSEVNLHMSENGDGYESENESEEEPVQKSDEDKNRLRKIFIDEMCEKFLNGEDWEYFNYEMDNIDADTEKEILRLQEIDEQDKYFDEDD